MMRYLALLLLIPGLVLGATGSTINEPALVGRSDIIHFESWENSDWWQQPGWWGTLPRSQKGWEYPNVTTNQSLVTTSSPVPGSKVFNIRLVNGSHVGTVNPRVSLNEYGLDEAYVRYYVWLDPDMVYIGTSGSSDTGKLPGLARRGPGDTQQCCMGQDYVLPADGAVGWSARFYWWGHPDYQDRVYFSNYVYHMNDPGTPGEQFQLSGTYNQGQWYCVEQRVKMNTPNLSDGIIQNWVDGVEKQNRTNVKLRSVQANNIGEVWFGVYVGGANVASGNVDVRFDNLVVARNRIGCYDGSSVPTPLATPAGITWND